MTQIKQPPFKENDWEEPAVDVETRDSGVLIVRSQYQPQPVADNLIAMFRLAVDDYPHRSFLARRGADGEWLHLSYADAESRSSCVAQWLLSLGLPEGSPVMVLSENSLEHAVFMLGVLKARLPFVPVSPGYSLLSADCNKLKRIYSLVDPSLVFVQDAAHYGGALEALGLADKRYVYVNGAPQSSEAISYEQILTTTAGPDVEASCRLISPETVAKILFTSGSTGEPKGVVNTHENMCFPHAAFNAVVHLDARERPRVMLDWLPWHHTYGGNQNINSTLRYAGTLYIDDGKPIPGLFEKTLNNLKDVKVTSFSTVPAAYMVLLDALEKDDELCQNLFADLEWFSYGGADMPQPIFDRIQALAIKVTGKRISVITALGATESTSVVTVLHWSTERMGSVGLPLPGTELKLFPLGDKFELRSKGPQIMPEYFKNPAATEAAFDEEGFFLTGDAVRWVDESDPTQGLVFAGRVAEDFKLLNGTWVHTGALRNALVSALSPLVADVVIAGHDREYVAVMVWPLEGGVREQLGDADTELASLCSTEAFRHVLRQKLETYNASNRQASVRVGRLLVLGEPPSLEHSEITEKRYVNQSAVLERRAAQVDMLYAVEPCTSVMSLS